MFKHIAFMTLICLSHFQVWGALIGRLVDLGRSRPEESENHQPFLLLSEGNRARARSCQIPLSCVAPKKEENGGTPRKSKRAWKQ